MWTVVKIAGIVSAVLVTLLFIALLVMVTRPALLLGVSESSLSSSIQDETTGAGCEKGPAGEWFCVLDDDRRFRVDVDWMGCWQAETNEPAVRSNLPSKRDGCIELADIITFD